MDENGVEETAARVSGEAYQIIGALAHATGLFDHPAVQRALDYFGYDRWRDPDADILPWQISEPNSPAASS